MGVCLRRSTQLGGRLVHTCMSGQNFFSPKFFSGVSINIYGHRTLECSTLNSSDVGLGRPLSDSVGKILFVDV